jgi:hypothetical protein
VLDFERKRMIEVQMGFVKLIWGAVGGWSVRNKVLTFLNQPIRMQIGYLCKNLEGRL